MELLGATTLSHLHTRAVGVCLSRVVAELLPTSSVSTGQTTATLSCSSARPAAASHRRGWTLRRHVQHAARLRKRQLAHQFLNLAMIVCSAVMIWKSLMVITSSESPVVVVLSGSMEPAFHRGDILFLHMGYTPFRAGDIVVFKVADRDIPIVHRVIKVHEKEDGEVDLLTKGDNNQVDDRGLYAASQSWINKEHIIGRAKGYLPYVSAAAITFAACPSPVFLSCTTLTVPAHRPTTSSPQIGMVTIIMNDYPMVKYVLVGLMGLFVLTTKE